MRRKISPVRFLVAFGMLIALLMVGTPASNAAVVRPFATRFTTNTTGAIMMTGNTVLTCPASATNCLAARAGTAAELAANNNNSYNMAFVDIDNDGSTFNSSRNTLTLPSGTNVLWAGLYWGADTSAGSGGSAAPDAALRNQVQFQTPDSSGYTTLTASTVDPSFGGARYQGFVDVTDLVVADRSGEYTVANVQAGRGADRYGGWAMVIAYQDVNEPLRNLTVLDGFAVVTGADPSVAAPVSGFVTPPTGAVRSRVGVVAYEGDLGPIGDSIRLNSTPLTNSLNPATNFFNSSLTGFNTTNASGVPFQTNMLGFDIDTINANGVLANGATSATINLFTNNDAYYPGVVSFSTELYAPRLDSLKSGVDINGGSLDVNDQVRYTITVTSAGDDQADNVVLTDEIPQGLTYVPGSLTVNGSSRSDAAGDDTGDYRTGPNRLIVRLGTGASSSSGGSMPIGTSSTISFLASVDAAPPDAITNLATFTYRATTSGLVLDTTGLLLEGASNTVVLSPHTRSDQSILKYGLLTVLFLILVAAGVALVRWARRRYFGRA